LIRSLSQATPRVDVLLGTSGDPDGQAHSIKAGADGFLEKPVSSISYFQSSILQHLPEDRQPKGLRVMSDDNIVPDQVAFRDDLAAAAVALEDLSDQRSIEYVAQFLGGVARSVKDQRLEKEMAALADLQARGSGLHNQVARVAAMVQDRLARTAQI